MLIGRLRSDRVLRLPGATRAARAATGRPPRHGPEFALDRPGHLARPRSTPRSTDDHPLRHRATATAWDRLHPRLTHRGLLARPPRRAADHRGHPDPAAGRPPARRPRPRNRCGCGPPTPAPPPSRRRPAAGRRSCAASTSNTPSGSSSRPSGWTTPKLRDPAAADRWTWLIIAAHTQLRLARRLTDDLRRPWERPAPAGPADPGPGPPRVSPPPREDHPVPAGAPKPSRPGPGRPPGSRNRAPRHPPRRRQDHQTRPDHHRTANSARVKDQAKEPA